MAEFLDHSPRAAQGDSSPVADQQMVEQPHPEPQDESEPTARLPVSRGVSPAETRVVVAGPEQRADPGSATGLIRIGAFTATGDVERTTRELLESDHIGPLLHMYIAAIQASMTEQLRTAMQELERRANLALEAQRVQLVQELRDNAEAVQHAAEQAVTAARQDARLQVALEHGRLQQAYQLNLDGIRSEASLAEQGALSMLQVQTHAYFERAHNEYAAEATLAGHLREEINQMRAQW